MSETTIDLRGREMSVERIDERIEELRSEILRLEKKREIVSSPEYKEAKEASKMKQVKNLSKKTDVVALLLQSLPEDVRKTVLQSLAGK